jgi:hypothetical protein
MYNKKPGPFDPMRQLSRWEGEGGAIPDKDPKSQGAAEPLSHDELTKEIELIDTELRTLKPEASPSPTRGMQLLELGHKTEVLKKLKHRRRKLEDKK